MKLANELRFDGRDILISITTNELNLSTVINTSELEESVYNDHYFFNTGELNIEIKPSAFRYSQEEDVWEGENVMLLFL